MEYSTRNVKNFKNQKNINQIKDFRVKNKLFKRIKPLSTKLPLVQKLENTMIEDRCLSPRPLQHRQIQSPNQTFTKHRKKLSIKEASRLLVYITRKCEQKVTQRYRFSGVSPLRSKQVKLKINNGDLSTTRPALSPTCERNFKPLQTLNSLCKRNLAPSKRDTNEGDPRLKIFKIYTGLNWEKSRISRANQERRRTLMNL
ncbi:unnamed protein product [Moneuplotes crassus]|uniref:Uncharacterized protein n=1 Tax=Euplotes crassus TaxID=5936 RepID=A0AAD2D993_EUPCR|nr:unnamed protein product [Moneuplotes crassus]